MDGLVIGLDLCDAYTQISCSENDKVWSLPTVICRKKSEDQWAAGEDAYGMNLTGEGVIADKLVSLAGRNGAVTIGDTAYSGQELLERFLKLALQQPMKECRTERIRQMVVTLPDVDSRIMDCLLYCADYLGIPRNHFHVISHGESFLYYVLGQKKEVWSNLVGLFELSQNGLRYYEMKIQRGIRQSTVLSDYEILEDKVRLDILDTETGAGKMDGILCTHGERLLSRKLFSSILLTGRGFDKPSWAVDFMKLICRRRKVYGESNLFVKGAACKAKDNLAEESEFPYVMICEGRLKSAVSLEVMHNEKPTQLVIAASGDSWYEAKSTLEFILDNQKELVFQIQPLDSRKRTEVRVPLEGFPERPNKTTRIQLKVGFVNENTMAVMIQDKGFGELFPASDCVIRREITI
ncbi:MAG: DUF5716 family protein [Lachnospiraceae bacterium]|nr:DUF5716 family protein [Lachnospiraceae bacterium]